jgi:DNA polymerase elongation subunit (family B)
MKALLPRVVEQVLKRRAYFKDLLKRIPGEHIEEADQCKQRIEALKKILVCLYGTTGSIWIRFGNVFAFEEINRLAREVLLKTKDIIQQLGYELVYADTDSIFLKKDGATRMDYENVGAVLSRETGLSISLDYHYKFLILLPLEADEKLEVLKHYFGITYDDELVMRGIETRRHDTPNFIKQFQHHLLLTLFNCKDSSEVTTKGYENALLVVIQAIDRIMTGEGIELQNLVISRLLRRGIDDYKSIFPHVAAAIQMSNEGKTPMRGQNIQYIHTDILYIQYIHSAAETVLGYFGFDAAIFGNDQSNSKKRKWWEELRQERVRDIDAESTSA